MGTEHTHSSTQARRGAIHPLWIALGAAALVLAVAFAPSLWRTWVPGPPVAVEGTPWQISPRPGGGIRVFGLDLPGTTLADARRRWGEDLQIAVMARPGEAGALEAYVERYGAGGIEGRLVLNWQADAADIARWRAAGDARLQEGGTQRVVLDAASLTEAGSHALAGVTFIAAASLTPAIALQRFGEPSQRVAASGEAVHWLYPERGLAMLIDPQGKDLLQFVAPVDFERRLRAPLQDDGARTRR